MVVHDVSVSERCEIGHVFECLDLVEHMDLTLLLEAEAFTYLVVAVTEVGDARWSLAHGRHDAVERSKSRKLPKLLWVMVS